MTPKMKNPLSLVETILLAATILALVLGFVVEARCQNRIDLQRQVKNVLLEANGGTGADRNAGVVNATLLSPTTADSGLFQFEFARKVTLKRLACDTDQGTASVNFDLRAESAPNAPGTAVLSVAAVCDSDGITPITNFAEATVLAHQKVAIVVSGAAGSPTAARLHLEYETTQ